MNSKRKKYPWYAIGTFVLSLLATSTQATSYVWTGETPSYNVYMGIVPAELVLQQPELLDTDKRLHAVKPGEKSNISHVFVFINDKPKNTRALDVTVVAEVGLLHGEKSIKPLEKMKYGASVSYGNFFKVHQEGEHTVRLKIFNPNSSGFEEVLFSHQGY